MTNNNTNLIASIWGGLVSAIFTGTQIVSSLTLEDWGIMIGIFGTFLSVVSAWIFKSRIDSRLQEKHVLEIEEMKERIKSLESCKDLSELSRSNLS